jgi:broad specificity phosphatase PhoE
MPSVVHLIRHGETANPDHVVYASLPGFGLTPRGFDQARRAASHLANRPVAAVWSSPLQRALETAGEIARSFGLPVVADDDLGEWQLLDRWAGNPWEELKDRFPGEVETYLDTPDALPFSPESLVDLAGRMSAALNRFCAREAAGDIVVVSHQDPIQAARLFVTGRDLARLHVDKPGHGSVISLRPGKPWEEIWEMTPGSNEGGQ